MKKITLKDIKSRGAEGISTLVRYAIIIVAALVFAMFYLIGFDIPFDEDPQYNDPMFTDMVIILMWAVLLAAIGIAGWSMARIIRSHSTSSGKQFGIPVRKISMCIAGTTAVLMLLSFLLSSTEAIRINGNNYTDTFWLRTAGMFVVSCGILLTAAIIAVIAASIPASHKGRRADRK